MRHCSVQVRGLLTREELDRYNALMEVGHYLESQNRYDLAAVVQAEIDLLIMPAIERLKAKSRERDRMTREFLEQYGAGTGAGPRAADEAGRETEEGEADGDSRS
ncbi:MAG TPA: hypothetical protein VIL22_08545 [Paenibacillaceae bacterium]